MFFTNNGISIPSISEEMMREVDRLAVQEFNLGVLQMMENAGRNLANLLIQRLKINKDSNMLIFAGSGGNGGGGLCAARHLLNHGIETHFILTKIPDTLTGAVKIQYQILKTSGFSPLLKEDLPQEILNADLIIDTLIGYSLKGNPKGISKIFIDMINRSGKQVISLDIPSGIDATSGEERNPFVNADQTLTLALPKFGLENPHCGDLYLADIGIPNSIYSSLGLNVEIFWGNDYVIPIYRKDASIDRSKSDRPD